MARRRTAPFVPLIYRRTICVANRKRKEKTKKTSIYSTGGGTTKAGSIEPPQAATSNQIPR